MTDQTDDERLDLEAIPLTLLIEYHNEPSEPDVVLHPGHDPFVAMRLAQVDGTVQVAIDASLIADDQDLIEYLEVVLAALVEERAARLGSQVVDEEDDEDEEVCGYSYDHDTSGANPYECRNCGAELEQEGDRG